MSTFKIRIRNIEVGWCAIVMHINGKRIWFNSEYTQGNPLFDLIQVCCQIRLEGRAFKIQWADGPYILTIRPYLDDDGDTIFLDMDECDEDDRKTLWKMQEKISFSDMCEAVIAEGWRVLNAYGLGGSRRSWMCDLTEFPVASLIDLTIDNDPQYKGYCECTSFEREVTLLASKVTRPRLQSTTSMDTCKVFCESWQLDYYGHTFRTGDKVRWTAADPGIYAPAADFMEDHHGFAVYAVEGTVENISMELTPSPSGKAPNAEYNEAKITAELVSVAYSRDPQNLDAEQVPEPPKDVYIWGYLVTLRDVKVELL